jgi:alpha-ribazole phosphatase
MRLILTRHGETEWNLLRKTQGRTDTALTETGLKQAEAIAKRLTDIPYDCVYTSPLSRARDTAHILAQKRSVPVINEPALIEMAFGEWEGMTFERIGEAYPEQFELWSHTPNACQIPGGEPFPELLARCEAYLKRILERHEGFTVVAVSHSVPTKVIAALCLGVPMDKLHSIRIDNVSLTMIDFYTGRSVMRVLNDTSHLPNGI